MEPQELEAGFENVQIELKSKIDLYVGKVIQTSDHEGSKVLCVVTGIDKVYLQKGKMTLDCKVELLHVLKNGE